MAALLSFEVVGAEGVKQGLASLMASLQDLTPFWRDVFAPRYFAGVQDLFATGGRSRDAGGRFGGGAWAPLSPRYRVWKEANFPGKPILELTGRLRESVRWGGNGPGAEGVFEASRTFCIVGTRVPYGAAHQHGTDRMPARPFLPTPDPQIFAPLMKDWILRSTGRA